MFNPFTKFPGAIQSVLGIVFAFFLCWFGLWLLAWFSYFAEKYGPHFIPWPH